MSQELQQKSLLIQCLDEDARRVEAREFREKTLQYLYDENLTEYSACAHLVAMAQGCPNALSAFSLCAEIASLVLNFTAQDFEKIVLSDDIGERFAHTNPFGLQAVRTALAARNHGVLFYVLVSLLPDRAFEQDGPRRAGVDLALDRIGLKREVVFANARATLSTIAGELSESPLNTIREIARSMLKNFDARLASDEILDFSQFDTPPALLGDGNVRAVFGHPGNGLRTLNIEDSYEEMVRGQFWVERFVEACS